MVQLVLIPGLACDAVMWQHQLAVLPQRLRPQVADVHFRSDSVEHMAQLLLAEHPGELILCGASMGGIIAMEAARQAPARIAALALLGTSARPETDEIRALREAAIVLFEDGRAAEVLRANVPLAFHASRTGDKQLVQTYLDFVLAAGAGALVRQNRAIMGRRDAREHLPALACPVLLMCGDCDQLTPPDNTHEIAALLPHAEVVIVPQCGHMLTMERPQQVNATLLGWLQRLAPATA